MCLFAFLDAPSVSPPSRKWVPGVKLRGNGLVKRTGHPTSPCRDSGWCLSGGVFYNARFDRGP